MQTKIHGRRLMGGSAFLANLAANYNSVGLYNDSTIGHLLRVDNWLSNAVGGTIVGFIQQGALTTLVGRGINLFSGEQALAGVIYTQQDTNAPPLGIFANAAATAQSPELTPWFYLRPGYSLVFKTFSVNLNIIASFWWEDLEMSMLDPWELM